MALAPTQPDVDAKNAKPTNALRPEPKSVRPEPKPVPSLFDATEVRCVCMRMSPEFHSRAPIVPRTALDDFFLHDLCYVGVFFGCILQTVK